MNYSRDRGEGSVYCFKFLTLLKKRKPLSSKGNKMGKQ